MHLLRGAGWRPQMGSRTIQENLEGVATGVAVRQRADESDSLSETAHAWYDVVPPTRSNPPAPEV